MTTVRLPTPTVRSATAPGLDVDALGRDLANDCDAEVRFDAVGRGAYSTDASNYREVPIGVVVPRNVDAAAAAVGICRRHGAPVVSRGGGTSLAGQCTNTAVVIDWSKHCNRLVSVDAEARSCIVEPGIVLDTLNRLLSPHDLEFGPRPATHSHCTLGGMIGNNSCGATAQRTGKVVDNVMRLEILLYDGTRMWVGPTDDDDYAAIASQSDRRAEVYGALRRVRDDYADAIRQSYPAIPRRVSGYNLDALLPEHGFDLGQLVVGSEGTLATVLHAELRLVPVVPARTVVLLGYPDVAASADAVPKVLPHEPIALEGLDGKLVDFERRKGMNRPALEMLPAGGAWLLVQLGAETKEAADAVADRLLSDLGRRRDGPDVAFFDDSEREAELWEVREAALGATARIPGHEDTWPGWEDSAVAPDRLGDYLRDLAALLAEFGYSEAALYGHFGQGCVHTRLPFDLLSADGVVEFRNFLERAADLVVRYGGSLSGEHGDGQARGELLTKMFGPKIVEAFGVVKAIFDPSGGLNPGKVVAPRPLDGNLRLGVSYDHAAGRTEFRYEDDDGDFSRAVLRCVGVGKCRREGGGVMCPSYMVTRDEQHSTRGRARLLFEMLDGPQRGGAVTEGWRSTAVLEALDLCLACKGCKSDCPVNVDMATYKAEFLAHHYRHRIRPAAHYSMGWLPLWAKFAGAAPRLVNRLDRQPRLAPLLKSVAGVDQKRQLPPFAPETFRQWFAARGAPESGERGAVLLWPDTFTNHFHPHVAKAAVGVLEAAGWAVTIPERQLCCGLTWISTGQLKMAKRVLRRTVSALSAHVRSGGFVVGLEPSCTAVFRSDAGELLPPEPDVDRLRKQTVTLAELLHEHTPGWQPASLDRRVVVQSHCHQHAVLGVAADRAVLEATGASVEFLDAGCCGLAGNFGFERGHYDVSMACAERALLPAIRASGDDDLIVADGFSCRTQIEQGDAGGRLALHTAEVLWQPGAARECLGGPSPS